jgi:predicted DNA-binding transcriptional regulator YafY
MIANNTATKDSGRVEAALPERLRARLSDIRLFAPGFHVSPYIVARLADLRAALDGRRKVWLQYRDVEDQESERVVRPLGLFFWGTKWTLTAWCELRNDFRAFRLDRVVDCRTLDDVFREEPGKTLDDFYAAMDAEDEAPSATP